MKHTVIQKQGYLYLTWDDMGENLLGLVRKILKGGKKYDRIVALAKGGLTWSRALADYLQIEKLSSIQIQFYTGIGETAKTPVIIQSLPTSISGERILIFDDVADSGETLVMAKRYLEMHGAVVADSATLMTKTWTKFQPTYAGGNTEDWIIFPHEIRETICVLKKKLAKEGMTQAEIQKSLGKLGISKEEIALFYKIS
jgi:hypoxanthine phosphoribosyltransferase